MATMIDTNARSSGRPTFDDRLDTYLGLCGEPTSPDEQLVAVAYAAYENSLLAEMTEELSGALEECQPNATTADALNLFHQAVAAGVLYGARRAISLMRVSRAQDAGDRLWYETARSQRSDEDCVSDKALLGDIVRVIRKLPVT